MIVSSSLDACQDCESGKFSEDGSKQCASCPLGQAAADDKGSCQPCKAGKFLQGAVCKTCPYGWIKTVAEDAACTICDKFHTSKDEFTACEKCDTKKDHYMITFEEHGTSSYTAFCFPCTLDRIAPNGGIAPGTVQNEVCYCPRGTFWDDSNFDCKNCPAGQYSNDGSTACEMCPAGKSDKIMTRADQISSCQACSAGQSSAASGAQCQPCDNGMVALNEGDQCQPCPKGTQFVDAKSECDVCSAGQYRAAADDLTCTKCPSGRFILQSSIVASDHDEDNDCQTCSKGEEFLSQVDGCSKCSKLSYQDQLNIADVSCKTCPGGKQSSATGATSINDCSGCAIGALMTAAAPALTCETCPAGQYRSELSTNVGDTCTTCDLGKIIEDASTTTEHDSKDDCTFCPKGYEYDGIESTRCLICGSGQYRDVADKENCTACPDNSFIADNRQEPAVHDNPLDCQACPGGQLSISGNAGFCYTCTAGKQRKDMTTECIDCLIGEFSTSANLVCEKCDAGFYISETASPFCLPCVPGEYQDEKGQGECKKCPVDEYSTSTKQTSCEKCTTGSSTDSKTGAAACEKCDAGKYGADCTKCSKGWYRGADDSTATCISCPSGFYQGIEGKFLRGTRL